VDGQGPIDGEMLLGLGSVSSATGVVGRAEEPCSLVFLWKGLTASPTERLSCHLLVTGSTL
jgi:hypothetical protein